MAGESAELPSSELAAAQQTNDGEHACTDKVMESRTVKPDQAAVTLPFFYSCTLASPLHDLTRGGSKRPNAALTH